jgi:hypothetical protein
MVSFSINLTLLEKSFESTLIGLIKENQKLFYCLPKSNAFSSLVSKNPFEINNTNSVTSKTYDSISGSKSETNDNISNSINTISINTQEGPRISVNPNFQTTFKITEYFKEEFEGLRKLFDVENDQFYHSLGSSKFFNTSGGKSNSDFMITIDGKVRII